MSGSWSSGRGFLGGRPRRRLDARILPFRNSCPPQTPQGSRRARAPSRHGTRTGHSAQIAFAWAMSWSSSEKKMSTSVAPPTRQAASSHQSSRAVRLSFRASIVLFPLCASWSSIAMSPETDKCPEKEESRRDFPDGFRILSGFAVSKRSLRKPSGRELGGIGEHLDLDRARNAVPHVGRSAADTGPHARGVARHAVHVLGVRAVRRHRPGLHGWYVGAVCAGAHGIMPVTRSSSY